MLQKLKNWWNAPLTYKRLYRDTFLAAVLGYGSLLIWILYCNEAEKEAKEAEEEAAEYDRFYEKLVNEKEDEP